MRVATHVVIGWVIGGDMGIVFMVTWLPHIIGIGVLHHDKNLVTKS